MRLVATATALVVFALAGHAQPASFQGLGDLPGGIFESGAAAVSTDGSTVVGSSQSASGQEAFIWDAVNGMQGLGILPGATLSTAWDVSGDGSLVVGLSRAPDGDTGFLWDEVNGMVGLGVGEPAETRANGISRDGTTVVGSARPGNDWFGVRWTLGGGVELLPRLFSTGNSTANAVSDDGAFVVGISKGRAVRWDAAGDLENLGFLPGHQYSDAYSTSADGSVVVGFSHATAAYEPFRWDAASGMQGLGCSVPQPCFTIAYDTSANGFRSVGFEFGVGAMLWENGRHALKDRLEAEGVDLTGWTLDVASGVSPDGTRIVGTGTNPDGNQEAFLAVLPEPGSAALLLGALLVGTLPRRRA